MDAEQSEIKITYDELIEKHSKWAAAEASSASDAGTRRQEFGTFIENCGLEGKALSQIRAGLKIKNEGKQQDWLRSMKKLLPLAEDYITGNTTDEMEFDETKADEPEVDEEDKVDFSDEETEEFDAEVDEALDGGDNVVRPFDGEAA